MGSWILDEKLFECTVKTRYNEHFGVLSNMVHDNQGFDLLSPSHAELYH